MPSGSHGGSSGSHSSGGSSFGGGSSSGSWGSSSGSYRSRPIRFHRHGRVYIVTKPVSGYFICALIVLIFALIPSIFGIWGTNKEIEKIETDYAYYQNMIVIAEKNPSQLIVQGTVTDCFKNKNCDKWYVTYEIRKNNVVLEGYTYSIYSMEEAQTLLNSTIDIAVNTYPITLNTDSIPVDYKYTRLSDDGEYEDAKDSLSFSIFAVIVFSIAEVILIVFSVRSFMKNAQLENNTESEEALPKEDHKTTPEFNTWVCSYCGHTNSGISTKCSNCGARK